MDAKVSPQNLTIAGALLVALCLLLLSGATERAQALTAPGGFVSGQVIVKTAPGVDIEDVNDLYGTQVEERFLDRPNTRIFLLEITDGSSTPDKVDELTSDLRLITYAEPNFLAAAPEAGARHRAYGQGDARPSPDNYAAKALRLPAAREIARGNGTTVAVLDTGAQLGHPALKANFEGVARRDFVGDDGDPSEPQFASNEELRKKQVVGHGTHVAGIVDQVAPAAKIMPLRVLNAAGSGNVFNIAEAVAFADDKGADVINLSLGTKKLSTLLWEVIEDATGNGVVVAAAAGNLRTDELDPPKPHYPAAGLGVARAGDGLLAVTSVNSEEERPEYANFGPWVDIAAPGQRIRSAFPVSRYANWSGTSMATPFVAGQAALIHEVNGPIRSEATAGEVEEQIRCSARPLGVEMGAGHADVGASVEQSSGCS